MNNTDTICYGGAIKALGDGWVRGPLIRFGDSTNVDLEGEFFDREKTDYGIKSFPASTAVYFEHGLDPVLGVKSLGEAELTRDEFGIWAKTWLDRSDRYKSFLYQMAEQGKLGWSSGSVAHLARREPVGKSMMYTNWPVVEATLSLMPADPQCIAMPIKSIADKMLLASSPLLAIKSDVLGEYVEQGMTIAAIDRADDALFFTIICDIISDESLTTEQRDAKILAAAQEFAALASKAVSIMADEEGAEEAVKSIRSHWSDPKEFLDKPRRTATKHAAIALTESMKQWDALISKAEVTGRKSGAMLSKANADSISELFGTLTKASLAIKELMDKAGIEYNDLATESENTDPAMKSLEPEVLREAMRFESLRGRAIRSQLLV